MQYRIHFDLGCFSYLWHWITFLSLALSAHPNQKQKCGGPQEVIQQIRNESMLSPLSNGTNGNEKVSRHDQTRPVLT